MRSVEIVRVNLDGTHTREAADVLAGYDPWVVTPSITTDCPGFTVTHAPSGARAWPQHNGPTSLMDAIRVARLLQKVWSGGGPIPSDAHAEIKAVISLNAPGEP